MNIAFEFLLAGMLATLLTPMIRNTLVSERGATGSIPVPPR
jgi:hypothetical protein